MVLNLKARKLRLIQEIMELQNPQTFLKIEQEVQATLKSDISKEGFWDAIRPIRKTISIDEMIIEQAYIPINKASFYKKTAKLQIEEPLEDLLSMLES